jgi:hypothetical protein
MRSAWAAILAISTSALIDCTLTTSVDDLSSNGEAVCTHEVNCSGCKDCDQRCACLAPANLSQCLVTCASDAGIGGAGVGGAGGAGGGGQAGEDASGSGAGGSAVDGSSPDSAVPTCSDLYASVIGVNEVCQDLGGKCPLAADTNANDGDPGQSCEAICQEGGGECIEVLDDGVDSCTGANPSYSCFVSDQSNVVCYCSKGCGGGPPCPWPKVCSSSQCI